MNNKWFTLIELLVWISISTVLMISVWLLISGWIKNITSQEKILQHSWEFSDFEFELNNILLNINTSFTPQIVENWTNTWVILKINNIFDKWWFIYIWNTSTSTNNWNWIYCLSWSEDINTNHIFTKSFIPFEESWEDVFTSDLKDIIRSELLNIIPAKLYSSYQKEHIIKDIHWNTIIWKWIFWDKFENWTSWTNIYLNSPTGITKSWKILFLSDTLNNRILYYNTDTDKIYKLLDESDWLLEPTGLYYDSTDNSLYISNSGLGEILKYSSENISTNPNLTLTWVTLTDSDFTVSLYNSNSNENITWITNITFNTYSKQIWDLINISNNDIKYTFSWSIAKTLTNEIITISWISNTLTNTWTYFVKLDKNNQFYPYFTQSDDNLLTKDDNTLEIVDSTLKYPTWIIDSSTFINFIDWTYENLNYNSDYDYILNSPIKDLDIKYSDDILTIKLIYYKKYNCYNLDEKSEKTIILKKNFK